MIYDQNDYVPAADAGGWLLRVRSVSLIVALAASACTSSPGPPTATVYARGLEHPSAFAFDGKGRLWVASAGFNDQGTDAVYVVPAGGGSIYAFWGRAGNGKGSADDGTAVGGLTKGADSAADQWELSYSYPLSLRTLLYAGFVKLNNRANARYSFNINDYSTAPGARPMGIVFGMAHFF